MGKYKIFQAIKQRFYWKINPYASIQANARHKKVMAEIRAEHMYALAEAKKEENKLNPSKEPVDDMAQIDKMIQSVIDDDDTDTQTKLMVLAGKYLMQNGGIGAKQTDTPPLPSSFDSPPVSVDKIDVQAEVDALTDDEATKVAGATPFMIKAGVKKLTGHQINDDIAQEIKVKAMKRIEVKTV